ncbi:MAG: HU family DNA-binding protein [Nitrospirae bacterium]|nr:HU family DNA-binding protein [Nitrospirota bacterium]
MWFIILRIHVGLPKKEADDIVEVIIFIMKETLTQGEDIKIPNFGTFHVRKKRLRRGRNPKTVVCIDDSLVCITKSTIEWYSAWHSCRGFPCVVHDVLRLIHGAGFAAQDAGKRPFHRLAAGKGKYI